MLKSEITDSVVELLQDKSAAARALVGRWINIVLGDIASRGLLYSLQREERTSLVAGTGSDMNTGRNYDLASDTDKVYKVFIPSLGTDGILRKLSHDAFLNHMLTEGAHATGQPLYYTIFGQLTLRIHPIPSLTYAPVTPTDLQKLYIWKYRDVTELTEQTNITEITRKSIKMIMMGAYAFGARFDDLADYPSTMQEYEKAIVDFFFQQSNDLDRPRQTAYNPC